MANIPQPEETDTEETVKGLLIRMPEDFHTDLKITCVRLKTQMNEFALETLRDAVKRAKKELSAR